LLRIAIVLIVLVLAVIVISGLTSSSKDNAVSATPAATTAPMSTNSTVTPSSSLRFGSDSTGPNPDRPEIHKIGEEFRVGYWTYRVSEIGWRSAIPGLVNSLQRAQSTFLLVNVMARNEDRTASRLPLFKLIDSQNREYEMSEKGLEMENPFGGSLSPEFVTDLNPGVSTQGNAVFDVPMDREYRLIASGGYGSRDRALVELNEQKVQSTIQAANTSQTTDSRSADCTDVSVLSRPSEPEARRGPPAHLKVTFLVDESGMATDIEFPTPADIQTADHALADAWQPEYQNMIRENLAEWRFHPSMCKGVPTKKSVSVDFDFHHPR
jgi:hypothetical protein